MILLLTSVLSLSCPAGTSSKLPIALRLAFVLRARENPALRRLLRNSTSKQSGGTNHSSRESLPLSEVEGRRYAKARTAVPGKQSGRSRVRFSGRHQFRNGLLAEKS